MKARVLAVVAFTICAGLTTAFAKDPKLDGAYKLVAIKTPNNTQTEANVKGMMVVHGNYMAFVRARVDRKTWSQDEPAEERTKKIVEAFQGLAATCGTFVLQGDNLTITQHAQANPGSMGAQSKWLYKLDGKNLTIMPQGVAGVEFQFERLP
jgi:hypothetical protein